MPIACVCPHCNAQSNAPDRAAGRQSKCPRCSGAFIVPTPPDFALAQNVPARQPEPEPWYYAYLWVCSLVVFLLGIVSCAGGFVYAVRQLKNNAPELAVIVPALGGVAVLVLCLFASASMFLILDMGRSLRVIRHNTERR